MGQNQRPPPAPEADDGQNERLSRLLDRDFNEAGGVLQSQNAPPSAVDAVDLVRFDYLAEVLGDAATYAVSASIAARRGNHQLVKVRTAQAKLAVDAALEVEAELGSLDAAPA